MKNKVYWNWTKRIRENLPEWSSRVFALRKKSYAGCGFHYALENRLGEVIKIANGHGHNQYMDDQKFMEYSILNETLVGLFMETLIKAEKSAKENEQ